MENENPIDPTIENEEKVEKTVEETPETDKMTESTDSSKKGFFYKKNNKEKAKIAELEKELENMKVEKAELNDRFLRLFSEFDNYKKRVNKEKLDLLATASEKVIVSLLPVGVSPGMPSAIIGTIAPPTAALLLTSEA